MQPGLIVPETKDLKAFNPSFEAVTVLILSQTKLQQTTLLFFLFLFYFYLSKKIRLDVSCESFAQQRIHMKYQVLFSLKNNEKNCKTVVCCICDWRLKSVN